MEAIRNFMDILTGMRWSDYLDIIIVAVRSYWVCGRFRASNTARIAGVVCGVVVGCVGVGGVGGVGSIVLAFSRVFLLCGFWFCFFFGFPNLSIRPRMSCLSRVCFTNF